MAGPDFTSRARAGRAAEAKAVVSGVLLDPQGVPYRPQARQAVFHACDADVVGYGGAAGGGKSVSILAEAYTCARETPGSYGILFRRSFPELERSLILKSRQMFPRGVCKYNEMTHRWTIRPERAGAADSFLDFGFAKTVKEARENYKSAEFNFLGIDEATLNEWEIISFLISRSRSSIPGHKPRIVMGTNPGGVGHVWFKTFFGIDDARFPPEATFIPPPTEEDPEPLSRCFIPAKLADNPRLSENDPKYRQKLMLLPLNERRMQMDGDWNVFEGRFFPEFTAKSIVAPESVLDKAGQMPKHWRYYRSVDYGYSDPFCCIWFAVAPDGHVYAYRELYLRQLRDKQQVELIKDNSFEPVEYTTCDPAMKQKNASGVSPYENYAIAGVVMVPSNNDRVMGWMAVRNLLAMHPDGTPILRVFANLKKTIGEIQDAVHSDDPKHTDDININSRRDHAIDTLRYWAVSRPAVPLDLVEDPYRHLDESSRREWAAIDKKIREQADGPRDRAVLGGINGEGDGDPWD